MRGSMCSLPWLLTATVLVRESLGFVFLGGAPLSSQRLSLKRFDTQRDMFEVSASRGEYNGPKARVPGDMQELAEQCGAAMVDSFESGNRLILIRVPSETHESLPSACQFMEYQTQLLKWRMPGRSVTLCTSDSLKADQICSRINKMYSSPAVYSIPLEHAHTRAPDGGVVFVMGPSTLRDVVSLRRLVHPSPLSPHASCVCVINPGFDVDPVELASFTEVYHFDPLKAQIRMSEDPVSVRMCVRKQFPQEWEIYTEPEGVFQFHNSYSHRPSAFEINLAACCTLTTMEIERRLTRNTHESYHEHADVQVEHDRSWMRQPARSHIDDALQDQVLLTAIRPQQKTLGMKS